MIWGLYLNMKIYKAYYFLFSFSVLILLQTTGYAQKGPRFLKPIFKAGEALQYSIKYGIFKCGEANLKVISIDQNYNGRSTIHFNATGSTSGTFDIFYKVRNRYDSFIDTKTFLPYSYLENIRENKYKRNGEATFDYSRKEIRSAKGNVPIKQDTRDILSAFYFARSLDLSAVQEGETIRINYYLEGEVSTLEIIYVGKEEITTPLGTFNCLKFSPSLKAGRIFRKDSKMYLWITDDADRVPVRAKAEILVGTIIMDLRGYSGLNTPLSSE